MRIHDSREWFDSVSPESLFESDYEKCILRNAEYLWPQTTVLPFKVAVDSEEGTACPDLVMLDQRYRRVWVVEVELSHHPLATHVEPQVRRLVLGRYGERHVDELMRQDRALLRPALERLFCGSVQPSVLLLVDRVLPNWKLVLSPLGVTIGVVELFRSRSNREILRLNGEMPGVPSEVVARCVRNVHFPSWLTIHFADPALFASGKQIVISVNGGLTRWTCRHLGRDLVLVPDDRCPLPGNYRTVEITFDERIGLVADIS